MTALPPDEPDRERSHPEPVGRHQRPALDSAAGGLPADPAGLPAPGAGELTRAPPARPGSTDSLLGPAEGIDSASSHLGTWVGVPAGAAADAPGVLPDIPGYAVEGEVARGGMGVVYKARHLRLNRPAAIKMILGGKYHDPAARVRFLVEAEAVAAVDHPHVVAVYEAGTHENMPFFALEYVGGGTLAARLARDGRPAPRAAAALVAKLADGVAAAHAKGIVHRDLKPANVLLTPAGEPKVADFGLARIGASDMTAPGAVMGTPSYMSPEQAGGRTREVGTPTDVYALGAILYELLTARPPFLGDTAMATIEQVLNREPSPPRKSDPAIPRDLDTICLKCLEKDPRRRYPTADALGADLRAFLDGRPIAARPVGAAERVWKWARRNPGRATVAAAAVLVLVGSVAAGLQVRETFARAEAEARENQRAVRADALVRELAAVDTAGVPRVVEDLTVVADLTLPRLREMAAAPVGSKPGLHARLALLADEPDRAAELTAYLPACRPEELLTIRDALTPHAGATALPLWAVLADEAADPGRRLRAAAALAGLTPNDARWATVAPAVADAAVLANPVEVGVWARALEPVRAVLTPPLVERYHAARERTEAGRLGASDLAAAVSAADVAAHLLARFASDRPAELAELAVTVDARHHARIADALAANRAAVVPLLRAELARLPAGSVWKDAPPDPAWAPVPAAARAAAEAGQGFVHDRFVLAQALPLAGFEELADALGPCGYRPVRVRPYLTPDGVKVAALWRRDGVAWRAATGLTGYGLRTADDRARAAGFQPVDVAGWVDATARPRPGDPPAADSNPGLRFAAVWEAAPNGTLVSRWHAGTAVADLKPIRNTFKAAGLGPLAVQAVTAPDGGAWYSEVWGRAEVWTVRGSPTEADYRTPLPDRTAVDVAVRQLADGRPNYVDIWHGGLDLAQERPAGLSATEHLARARELAAAGWRPAAVSVAGADLAASVWHRPAAADAAAAAQAARRANAAAALLAAGEAEPAWPLFRHSPDPTDRSYLIHRAAGVGADPAVLVRRFRAEPDVSARRALLLALGEYPPGRVPAEDREFLSAELLGLYRDHPDPGLHGAIDWLLRQRWGKAAEVAAADAALAKAAAPPAPGKDWFVDREGRTFTLVRGPVTFLWGSPPTEPGRNKSDEGQRPRRIGRSFAVGAREVTTAEFLRFRPRHNCD
ncbi:MAG TPA: serine/threonine-protein kinase, partial [Urbifossiella sp.]|nr:serine/threonine-protein kinase [Urbifossiella sp.]